MRGVQAPTEKNKRGYEFELQTAGKKYAEKAIYFRLAEIFNLEVRDSEQAGGSVPEGTFILFYLQIVMGREGIVMEVWKAMRPK